MYSIVGIVGFRRKGKKRFRRKESFFIRRHSKSFDRSPIFFKRITGRSSLLLTGLKAVPQDPRSSIEVESKAIFFPRRRRRVYNQPHRQIKSFARRLLQRDSSIYPFLPSLFSPPSPSLLFSIAMERSAEPDAKGKIRRETIPERFTEEKIIFVLLRVPILLSKRNLRISFPAERSLVYSSNYTYTRVYV